MINGIPVGMRTDVYTISELQDFIATEKYRNSGNIPVSPERARSYAANPRGEPDMPVLFTLTDQDRIVAYRTLLPDRFSGKDGLVRFAWLSGNFVDPSYRRKGLSTRLFKTVEESWEGKLLYTNYAPASRAVYDKTGVFREFLVRPGKRYYLRSALYPLLRDRVRFQGLLKFSDRFLNGIHDMWIAGSDYPVDPAIKTEAIKDPDTELSALIVESSRGSLFQRAVEEFKWIRDHSWITSRDAEILPGKYQFTRRVEQSYSQWFKLSNDKGTAFLWITVVNDKCSVPYFFQDDMRLTIAARQIVFNTMIGYRCSHITIRDQDLGPVLGTKGNPFLFSKMMPQRYYAHKEIADMIPFDPKVFDGDGDCVFT